MVQPSKRAGKQTKPGTRGPQRKVLVGVRVPADFHRRIQSELVRRDLTLQEMVVDALKQYFENPVDWDYVTRTYVRHPTKLAREAVLRREARDDLWVRCVNLMPEEKIEMYSRAMEWDLRTIKSSRRKPTWKSLAPKEKG